MQFGAKMPAMQRDEPKHQLIIEESPLGPIRLVASVKGLRGLYLNEKSNKASIDKGGMEATDEIRILEQAARELREYFAGERQAFSVPLDPQGTEFQQKVWKALSKIPFGNTCSYRDVAAEIKNEKAFRAVGSANGKNPICIIVPCHRVIAADGTLGGYSGGLHHKTALLELERRTA